MTVRVITLKGVAAGAYYVDQLPNYYLDTDEPRGHWHGQGAEILGLRGEVVDGEFLAVMGGHQPTRPDIDLGLAYGERSVRGFDVTASAPKSVSFRLSHGRSPGGVLRSGQRRHASRPGAHGSRCPS